MSLFIASLNSGSNGNCYYVGNQTDAVLVDAGLSCRETERRMKNLGLAIQNVRAIFVSHEHGDHIKGVQGLSKKYNLPVFVTPDTKKKGKLFLYSQYINEFRAGDSVSINQLSVTAFAKYHDAVDPHSFIVEGNGITIGVFTDIGKPCERLTSHFSKCHAAFLEANYDADMLKNGRYPESLKNRIRGGEGHLSNEEALEVFKSHRPSHMSHLLLAHLSKDNNDPKLAAELFEAHANGVNIIIASRYEATGVFEIKGSNFNLIETAPKQLVQSSMF